jgi:hypothetical protein
MKLRKITSLTALLAFFFLVVTSIVLYVVPQGRVAYWADWRFLGLTKVDWGNIHINLGLLLLLAMLLHVYYNWKPIVSYLKNRSRQLRILTPEFNVAFLVTFLFVAGTYLTLPPFSWVLDLNESLKVAGARKYGEPPYGHAELSSLKAFARKTGLDPQQSVQQLQAAGYRADSVEQTLAELGRINRVPPQQLYQAMQPEPVQSSGPSVQLPESPPPGTGNLTLADLCAFYDLDLDGVLAGLAKDNIRVSKDDTLKNAAAKHQLSPVDLYDRIRAIAGSSRL